MIPVRYRPTLSTYPMFFTDIIPKIFHIGCLQLSPKWFINGSTLGPSFPKTLTGIDKSSAER